MRPIHHQLAVRIEAHIFVAFLAYCLSVTLRKKLQAHAPGLTPRAVLEKLSTILMLDVHLPLVDGRELVETFSELGPQMRHSRFRTPRNHESWVRIRIRRVSFWVFFASSRPGVFASIFRGQPMCPKTHTCVPWAVSVKKRR
jgi:hypothetical protein